MFKLMVTLCMLFAYLSQLFTGLTGAAKPWSVTVEGEYGKPTGIARVLVDLDSDLSRKACMGYLGKCGTDTENTAVFSPILVPEDGWYTLEVSYLSGADDRYFDVYTGDCRVRIPCGRSGDGNVTATESAALYLYKGCNRLVFGSDWYAPDLDCFTLTASDTKPAVYPDAETRALSCGGTTLLADTHNGVFDIQFDGQTVLRASDAAVCLADGMLLSASDFSTHTVDTAPLSDAFGTGLLVTFTHSGTQAVTLTQHFRLYEQLDFFLTELVLAGDAAATNYMAPVRTLAENSVRDVSGDAFDAYISIPYDNEGYSRVPTMEDIDCNGVSHELTALLNTDTNSAVVAGSLTHDTWKTGIDFLSTGGTMRRFSVYAGAADVATQDRNPHGTVAGTEVHSSLLFLGSFSDWRDGFDAFGAANTTIVPAKQSVSDKVPFGFNSWGVLQTKVSYSAMCAVSDYIAANLQDTWEAAGGTVYVNMDSFWDFLLYNEPTLGMTLDEALAAFTAHCRQNGQQAGIYMTPFACWHNTEEELRTSVVPGTDGLYTYYDIALKNPDGTLFGRLGSGWPLDPTHPGTTMHNQYEIDRFLALGFSYVKMDFMSNGAIEGAHYDPTVTTGTQAYHFGMTKLAERIGDSMFVNLSIAPIFPYEYADGRRVSCDAFYDTGSVLHMLRSVSFCFWQKQLYTYPDPDHLLVWGGEGQVPYAQARARVTSGVIAGTSFLTADNYASLAGDADEANARIAALLANPEVCALAAKGRMFRPVNASVTQTPASIYSMRDGDTLYLAVFNFNTQPQTFHIPLRTLGITDESTHAAAVVSARDLWRQADIPIRDDTFTLTLDPGDAALIAF